MMGGAMMTTHSDDSDEEDDKILVTAHFAIPVIPVEN